MRVGDKVIVRDGSWTRSIINGKLVHESLLGTFRKRHYTVVETGCVFPLVNQAEMWEFQPKSCRNDTVIQDDTGKVVLICSKFLDLVDPPHEWKHGDVFRNVAGIQIYLEPHPGPIVVNVEHTCSSGTPEVQLPGHDTVFLFNIKEKL